jgi:hypothetical protein
LLDAKVSKQIVPTTRDDRLPALYVREIDRDLHCVVSFWEGGGVGMGTPVLRRPFKAPEQSLLEHRVWELRCAVAPFEARSRDALLQAISGMLGAFPMMQRFDQHVALSIAAGYLMTVRQQPHWAILRACELVRTNKAGLNPDFCPSEPQFVTVVVGLVKPYADALRRAEQLLEAKVDAPSGPKLTGVRRRLRRKPHRCRPATASMHAGRVMADLAAQKALREAHPEQIQQNLSPKSQ